jgi:SAM-dependent methyltransferase
VTLNVKASDYYSTSGMTTHIAEASMMRADRLSFCLPESLEKKRILDLGCGPGVQIAYLARKNLVCGLDAGLSLLKEAHEHRLEPCQADAQQAHLPFADECFDALVCTDVLEHLISPMTLLREIHRVLKPDGVAVIGIPNQFDLAGRLRILTGGNLLAPWDHKDFDAWTYFHLHFWTLTDFADFLREGGFKIVKQHYSQSPSNLVHVATLLTKADYVRDWRRRHPKSLLKKTAVTLASLFLRLTGAGRFLVPRLPAAFPALFTGSHLASAVKER